jgi:hypothetical protein
MTREQFLEQFARLPATDEMGLAALAKQVVDDAREAVRAAVELWATNPAQAQKAASLLVAVDELAFVPLTERGDPADARQRVWLLRTSGKCQQEFRGKLVGMINRMLDDRRVPPARPMPGPPLEERPSLPRVCDEAYLAHRRLLNYTEDSQQFAAEESAFLALPEAKRDEEILHLRRSNTWSKLSATR